MGHTDVIKELAKAGADVDGKNRAGFFPLYRAALNGHGAAVKALLDFDASTDMVLTPSLETPLMAAAFGGHIQTVKELIKGKVDVNAANNRGKTALHKAPLLVSTTEYSRLNLYKYEVQQYGSHMSILVQVDRVAVVKAIVDGGGLINLEDDNANTILHIASQFGMKNIIDYLLKEGADPEIVNSAFLTPREVICECLEFVDIRTSLQCPANKCGTQADIRLLRKIIDSARKVRKCKNTVLIFW